MEIETLFNKYADQADSEHKSALTKTALAVHRTDPEKYANNIKAAKKAGIHPALATPAEREATPEELHGLINEFHTLKGATAQHISNPDVAQIAHDDHPNMTLLEGVMNSFKGAGARMAAGVNQAAGATLESFGLHQGSQAYKQGAEYWRKVADKSGSTGIPGKIYEGIGSAPQGVAEFVAGVPYAAAKGGAEGYRKGGVPGLVQGAITESVKRFGIGKVFSGIESSAMKPITKSLTMAGTMGGQTAAEGGSIQDVVASTVTGLALMPPKAGSHGEAIRADLVNKGVDPKIAQEIGTHVDGVVAHENAGRIQDVVDTAKASKLKIRDADLFKSFTQDASKDAKPIQIPVDKFDKMLAEKGLKPEDVFDDPTHYYESKYEGGKVNLTPSELAGIAEHVTPERVQEMNVEGAPSLADIETKGQAKVDTEPGKAQETTTTDIIRPAVKVGDEIKTGADGERHTDIVKDAPKTDRGFTLDGKEMMSRKEAANWLKETRPDLYEKLPADQKAELHSEGLWKSQGIETPEQTTVNLNMGINPLDGVKAAMKIAGDIKDSKTGKAVEKLMTPGLEAATGIKRGIQSLVLPTAKSPEHLQSAELLGAKLGKMHRNQEMAADFLRPDELAFDKIGVRNEKIDLTQNPGIQFMSDMSQGRTMAPKMERIAKKVTALFDDRLKQLEAADVPMEQVRENYFPGMWTNESRKAFNLAIGGAIEAGRGKSNRTGAEYGKTMPLADWTSEDKQFVRDRVKDLLDGGKGSEKDGLQYLSRTPFKGKESFRKGKVFDDIMTAVEFGLEPISRNPIDLVKLKLAEMDRSIMANSALKDWRASGDEKLLRVGEKVPEGWVKVNDKYGTVYGPRDMAGEDVFIGQPILGHRIVKEPVADVLNNFLSSSLYNNKYFGTLYKGYMGAANALNQSQLGVGSFFHVGFTESEVTISSGANLLKDIYGVAVGNRTIKQAAKSALEIPQSFIKTPMEGDAILKEWRNPESSMNPRVQQIAKAAELAGGGFKIEQGLKTEQSAKLVQDWYSDHKVRAAMRSPIAAVELMAKPIMEYIVPRQKAGVFGHLAWRIIEQNPGKTLEQLTPQFRQAWNRVDARLGQVRYDRLFMNNAAKNAVQGLVRAPGWTGGTIAEIGGSFKDTVSFLKEWADTGKAPKELPDRVAYTISLMATVTAINGALTWAFTGDKPNGTDWWAFRTGGVDEFGRPERFLLPTYQKDVYAYLGDPGKTLLAKTHPIISIMGDLLKNKDYYGVTIANEDDNYIEKSIDRGIYTLKAFTPFWMRGAAKEAERGGGLMETLQNQPQKILAPQIGIMPATSEYTKTPAEKLLTKYIGQQIPQGGRTTEQAEESKARRELVRALRMGKTMDDLPEKLQEKAAKFTDRQIKNIEKDAELTPLQSSFKKMQDPNMEKSIKVWAKMTDSERDESRDIYETKINKYLLQHDLEGDELDKLNQRIEAAEARK